MSKSVLKEVLSRPQICARINEGMCSGRLTIEHAFGRKMEASWNCLWLCWFHHLGKGLNKELNRHLAYQYATGEDLNRYKTAEAMRQEKLYLQKKYDPS